MNHRALLCFFCQLGQELERVLLDVNALIVVKTKQFIENLTFFTLNLSQILHELISELHHISIDFLQMAVLVFDQVCLVY